MIAIIEVKQRQTKGFPVPLISSKLISRLTGKVISSYSNIEPPKLDPTSKQKTKVLPVVATYIFHIN